MSDMKLVRMGMPDDGKFTYPVAKRRTKENVELMRICRGKSGRFLGSR